MLRNYAEKWTQRFVVTKLAPLLSDSPLSPVLRGEGLGVRGKRRRETPKPLAFTKPLTPGPSPLNTGERGVAPYC